MREMTDKEKVMFNILKNDPKARASNYEAVRQWYKQVYNVNMPSLSECEEQYGTVERWVRGLKALYPHELGDDSERKIHSDLETKFKEEALDRNKPYISQKEMHEQTSLLMGGDNYKEWW